MFLRSLFCLTLLSSSIYAQHEPRFEGQYEEFGGNRLEVVSWFIPENPVIFEAGGHYGNDTVRFAAKWPNGKILTFEPNPHAYEMLLQTTAGIPNIYPQNIAVNNYNGTAILNVCYGTNGDNPVFEGASSLLPPSDGMQIHYQGPKVEVPCVILDDWCAANDVDHIDFMWLDLEGLELPVLKSSPQILSKVKVIYTETNFYEFRVGMTQFANLREFLESQGFQLVSHWYTEGLQGDAIFVRP